MTKPHHIYCGKCGNPNPPDNLFCRKCGHRLADDVVSHEEIHDLLDDEETLEIAPIEGIELQRFPLLHPESGEPVAIERDHAGSSRSVEDPDATPRGKIILVSLGVHMVVIPLCLLIGAFITAFVVPTPEEGVTGPESAQLLQLQERLEGGEITSEQLVEEMARLFNIGETQLILMLVAMMAMVFGFFLSGVISGKLWKPQKLFDVAVGVMMVGLLVALIAPNAIILCLMGVPASLLGALLGRRWAK